MSWKGCPKDITEKKIVCEAFAELLPETYLVYLTYALSLKPWRGMPRPTT